MLTAAVLRYLSVRPQSFSRAGEAWPARAHDGLSLVDKPGPLHLRFRKCIRSDAARAVSGNRVLETLRCLSESSMRGMEFPKQVSDGDNRPTSQSALLIELLLIRSAPHGDHRNRNQFRLTDPA